MATLSMPSILPNWLAEQIRAAQEKGLPTFRESENQSMADLATMQMAEAASRIPWEAPTPNFRQGEIKSLEDLEALIAPALEQRTVREAPLAGQPYAQPDAGAEAPLTGGQIQTAMARAAPVETGSTARPARRTAASGSEQPGILDYGLAFLSGLSGKGGLNAVRELSERTEARNATYDAILRKTGDEDFARAVVLNPEIAKAVIPVVFGRNAADWQIGEIFDEQTGAPRKVFWNTKDPTQVIPIGGVGFGSGADKPPSGFEWVDPRDRSKGLRAIPGGPGEHISSEVAGRLALMETAAEGVKDARKVFERRWGLTGAAQSGAANLPLIGDVAWISGDIGRAQRAVRIAVEAALRAMTGAAAPEQEVARYVAMFTPGVNDTRESTKQKLDALETFMTKAREIATRGRRSDVGGAPGALGSDPLSLR